MQPSVASLRSAWESFYVIIGGAAAALTGLQFVVITLTAQVQLRGNSAATRTFGTPTIVHFCAVLFVAATMSAPWRMLAPIAIAVGACGTAGLAFAVFVTWQIRRQTAYQPVPEDWIYHAALPIVAYAALLVAAFVLPSSPEPDFFLIGGTAVLLLFIAIHNAWDSVVFIAIERNQTSEERGDND